MRTYLDGHEVLDRPVFTNYTDLRGTAPEHRITEMDQVSPVGRWRDRLEGDTWYWERATGPAATPWDTDEDWVTLDKPNERLLLGKNISQTVEDAANGTVTTLLTLNHNTTVAPAAGLGVGLDFGIETADPAGAESVLAASIDVLWSTATHATRTSDVVFYTVNSATMTEMLRLDGSRGAVLIQHATQPTLEFRDTGEADPVGSFRLISASKNFSIQMALTADFATIQNIFAGNASNKTIAISAGDGAGNDWMATVAAGNSAGEISSMRIGGSGATTAGMEWRQGNGAGTNMVRFRLLNFAAECTAMWDDTSTIFNGSVDVIGTNENPLVVTKEDSANGTISTALWVRHNTAVAAAPGLGVRLSFNLETTTNDNVNAGWIDVIWTTATMGTRRSDMVFSVEQNNDSTMEEMLRLDGSEADVIVTGGLVLAAATAPATADSVWLVHDNTGDLTANVRNGKAFHIAENGVDEYDFTDADFDCNSNTISNIGAAGNNIGAAQFDLAAGYTILGANILNINTSAGGVVLTPATNVIIPNGKGLVIGTSDQKNIVSGGPDELQMFGSAIADSSITLSLYNNATALTYFGLRFTRTRAVTAGSHTSVNNGDAIGAISWYPSDGSNENSLAARIYALVSAAPGSGDMPTDLLFLTCADTAGTAVERWRITNAGVWLSSGAGTISANGNLALSPSGHVVIGSGAELQMNNTGGYVVLAITDADSATEAALWYSLTDNKLEFWNGAAVEQVQSAGFLWQAYENPTIYRQMYSPSHNGGLQAASIIASGQWHSKPTIPGLALESHEWNIGDKAIMVVESFMHRGSVHALPYPFEQALRETQWASDIDTRFEGLEKTIARLEKELKKAKETLAAMPNEGGK